MLENAFGKNAFDEKNHTVSHCCAVKIIFANRPQQCESLRYLLLARKSTRTRPQIHANPPANSRTRPQNHEPARKITNQPETNAFKSILKVASADCARTLTKPASMTSNKICVVCEETIIPEIMQRMLLKRTQLTMTQPENDRIADIMKTAEDMPVGLIMIYNLRHPLHKHLNMQFGTVLLALPDGRLSVQVAGTGRVVSIKKQNVTRHHSGTLVGIWNEKYNGKMGSVLSLVKSREVVCRVLPGETPDFSRREEGEPREYEEVARLVFELWETKRVHHVRVDNIVPNHCQMQVMLIPSLSGLKQYYEPGNTIIFFESDAMISKREAEEKCGETRCAKTQVMWPGGPELVISQVIAHYGSTETDEAPCAVQQVHIVSL